VQVNVKPGELQTVRRLERIVSTALGAHDQSVMDEYQQLIVRLPAGGYGVIEFDLSPQRLDALLEAGRQAMAGYFNWPQPAAIAGEGEGAPGTSSTVIDRRAREILAY
jgi:hypothetical protein